MNCARCNGKGVFSFRRVHMGVPGLCFRCDGTGAEPDAEAAFVQRYLRAYGA